MNRVMSRAKILLVPVMILALGISIFLGDYFLNSKNWVYSAGSPHIYNPENNESKNIGCGLICDRDGNLLVDLTGDRIYADIPALRMATVHWLGDRSGNVSAPALSKYAKEIAGFNPVSGVYDYDGVGGEVQLTLSSKLQMAALEAMGEYKGTFAMINYKTGEILCAVSTPTFDPDNVPDIEGDTTGKYGAAYFNRFTRFTYAPGSIFKIVTMIAALESIPDLQEQTFTCTGEVEYGIDKVTCEKIHGDQNVREAFMNSCNCAFAKISEQIGGKRLARYAKELGLLDSLTFDGIETPVGNIDSADQADVLVAWSAIGQHKDLINPATFLSLVGSIANEGARPNMHIVENIKINGVTTYQVSDDTPKQLISPETAKLVSELMRYNVENYYGDEEFAGFTVCAKSGTAEVGGDKKPNAMFTGFVTDEELPIAFIVAIENGGYGRLTCIPVLEKVLMVCREGM